MKLRACGSERSKEAWHLYSVNKAADMYAQCVIATYTVFIYTCVHAYRREPKSVQVHVYSMYTLVYTHHFIHVYAHVYTCICLTSTAQIKSMKAAQGETQ